MSDLWMLAGLMVLGQFSPGPDMMLLTRTALREGAEAGVKMALGICTGLMVHASLAVAGVAVMFDRLPTLRRGLEWLAAIYLLWLAYGLVRECFAVLDSGAARERNSEGDHRPAYVRGLLCNLLNPKVALFLAAVCAPFLVGKHPAWWPLAIWGLIVGLGVSLWCAWVLLLQWRPLRLRYESKARWIDGLFGLGLAALALRLMLG